MENSVGIILVGGGKKAANNVQDPKSKSGKVLHPQDKDAAV